MAEKKRKYIQQGVLAGTNDYTRAWAEGRGRNRTIFVDVLKDKSSPEGEPDGQWDMPGVLGVVACIRQAAVQTKKESNDS